MSVWVNVWGGPPGRRGKLGLAALVCALALSGCIDDFDHPKGYGRSPGASNGSNGTDGCAELCTEYASCDSSTSASECRSQCGETERLVRAAGCDGVYDDLLDCYARADDLCAAPESCAREVDDFAACISDHCLNHIDGCPI
ncbi:MAG TPA: hypothetical protein VMS65_04535 [Polyangiaceae bacterium]|nr:hypothetical protein [Polyangiaceae bacterium]